MKPTMVITGAGRGIGQAIAEHFSRTHHLVLVGRSKDNLEKTKELVLLNQEFDDEDPGRVETIPFDMADVKNLPILLNEIVSRNKDINVLVNNAGLCVEESIYYADLAKWDEALAVNLHAVINLTNLCMPQLKLSKQKFGSAAIINISSTSGHRVYAKGANYCATKWGLNGFTAALFEDVRYDGIKVCAICPGFVNTDMHANSTLDGKLMIQPQDIAETVQFVLDFPNRACPTEITIYPQKDPRGRR